MIIIFDWKMLDLLSIIIYLFKNISNSIGENEKIINWYKYSININKKGFKPLQIEKSTEAFCLMKHYIITTQKITANQKLLNEYFTNKTLYTQTYNSINLLWDISKHYQTFSYFTIKEKVQFYIILCKKVHIIWLHRNELKWQQKLHVIRAFIAILHK